MQSPLVDKKRGDGAMRRPLWFSRRNLSETGLLCGVATEHRRTERTSRHPVVREQERALEVATEDGRGADALHASVVAGDQAVGETNETGSLRRNRRRDDRGKIDILERRVVGDL